MQRLWPTAVEEPDGVQDADIETIYKYPDSLNTPYVRLNFSCSVSGNVAVDGRSAGLGSAADKKVFGRLRRLSDVILVGAGTIRADRYRGARTWEALRAERRARGQGEIAPIAVVTASADIDVDGPLFTDAWIPPIILTVQSAAAVNVERLVEAGADVLIVGEKRASAHQIIDVLAARNLYRILCEGGASLFGDLIAADVVDEVCFTLSPHIGGTGKIAHDTADSLRALRLRSVLTEEDSLLIRYTRQ
ncbi:MAG: pyrimidine reductase family protein [Acetobacteraceae bacterium]